VKKTNVRKIADADIKTMLLVVRKVEELTDLLQEARTLPWNRADVLGEYGWDDLACELDRLQKAAAALGPIVAPQLCEVANMLMHGGRLAFVAEMRRDRDGGSLVSRARRVGGDG